MNNLRISRIEYEKRVIVQMLSIYCKGKHKSNMMLCEGCEGIKEYALLRLDKCVFENNKPACRNCKVHCYKLDKRNQIRKVMRYAGPRMMFYYPIDFFVHYLFPKKRI